MAPSVSIALFVVLAGVALVFGQDYCKLCPDHSMCKYKGDGADCKKILARGVDGAAQTEVLKIHNDLRRKIATGQEPGNPAAGDMREMKWDAELAKVAQRWAEQCIYGHDDCRLVERFKVGQNVRYSSSSTPDTKPEWTRGVQSWYDEVKDWKVANISPFSSVSGVGHFTQVAWAGSYLLGCGYVAYQPSAGKITKLYVCNYGPRGNMNGDAMYKQGKACSACPAGTTCKNSLCA